MKKFFAMLLVLLMIPAFVFAADVHVIATGSWFTDRATVWSTGAVPAAGDNLIWDGAYTVTLDAGALPLPNLGSITSVGVAGVIAIPMNTLAQNVAITFTTAQAGTIDLFTPTGAAAAFTLTLNGTSINGSNSTTNKSGLYGTSTCNYTFNIKGKGGSAIGGMGINISANGPTITTTVAPEGGSGVGAHGMAVAGNPTAVAMNANMIGGTGRRSCGVYNDMTTGTFTIGAGYNIINAAGGPGYFGAAPTWTPAATNYITFATAGGNYEFAKVVAAGDLRTGVTNGTVIGTYLGGTMVEGTP